MDLRKARRFCTPQRSRRTQGATWWPVGHLAC